MNSRQDYWIKWMNSEEQIQYKLFYTHEYK